MIGIGLAAALLASAAPSVQDGLPSSPEIRRSLESILASGEYDTGDSADLRRTFWQWLWERIRSLFRSLEVLHTASPAVYWLILAGCLVVLGLIFTHAGVVLTRALRAARSTGPGGPAGPERGKDDPSALLARAREEASAARFDGAVRLCHRAALLGLDRRGLLRFHESLTTGDYDRQLRDHGTERERFRTLARVYEPAYFGRVPVDGKAAEECLVQAGRLVGGERP
jgi:hypothetical protein